MRIVLLSVLAAVLLAPGQILAQARPRAEAPPPPEMNDPGVTAVDRQSEVGPNEEVPVPEKLPARPSAESAPTVTIRTRSDGDVVEEYRINGRLSYVRVTPQRGIPYTLRDTNGDGRLDSRDSDGPVQPVYYTLYEWD